MALMFLVGVALCAASGCGGRGDAATGQACEEDNDCAHGLCVGGVSGEGPTCTISCATRSDCPHGWSCSGVTQSNVLVCSQGSATPFGDGAP